MSEQLHRGGVADGITLAETLVALLLLTVVLGATLPALARARVTLEAVAVRAEHLEARRVVRSALLAETRYALPHVDWIAGAGDSVRVRAFRGSGYACDTLSPDVAVRYAGLRRPDPAKDSVLALSGAGWWRVSRLAATLAPAGRCGVSGSGQGVEVLRLDPPVGRVTAVRLFESGSYHLHDRALRYRRGAGGRQPLTATVFDTRAAAGGGLEADAAALVLRLVPDAGVLVATDTLSIWAAEAWP